MCENEACESFSFPSVFDSVVWRFSSFLLSQYTFTHLLTLFIWMCVFWFSFFMKCVLFFVLLLLFDSLIPTADDAAAAIFYLNDSDSHYHFLLFSHSVLLFSFVSHPHHHHSLRFFALFKSILFSLSYPFFHIHSHTHTDIVRKNLFSIFFRQPSSFFFIVYISRFIIVYYVSVGSHIFTCCCWFFFALFHLFLLCLLMLASLLLLLMCVCCILRFTHTFILIPFFCSLYLKEHLLAFMFALDAFYFVLSFFTSQYNSNWKAFFWCVYDFECVRVFFNSTAEHTHTRAILIFVLFFQHHHYMNGVCNCVLTICIKNVLCVYIFRGSAKKTHTNLWKNNNKRRRRNILPHKTPTPFRLSDGFISADLLFIVNICAELDAAAAFWTHVFACGGGGTAWIRE